MTAAPSPTPRVFLNLKSGGCCCCSHEATISHSDGRELCRIDKASDAYLIAEVLNRLSENDFASIRRQAAEKAEKRALRAALREKRREKRRRAVYAAERQREAADFMPDTTLVYVGICATYAAQPGETPADLKLRAEASDAEWLGLQSAARLVYETKELAGHALGDRTRGMQKVVLDPDATSASNLADFVKSHPGCALFADRDGKGALLFTPDVETASLARLAL